RATVLLPEPLSPTRPSVSPRAISKETPLTAATKARECAIGKCLTRPSTRRTGEDAPLRSADIAHEVARGDFAHLELLGVVGDRRDHCGAAGPPVREGREQLDRVR